MDIYYLLIAIAAIWGAILSTSIAIRNYLKEKPKLKVVLYSALIFGTQKQKISPHMVILKAANIGAFNIDLLSFGFILPSKNNKYLYFSESGGTKSLPCKIYPRKTFRVLTERAVLAKHIKNYYGLNGVIKISGFFEDTLGNLHVSKKMNIFLGK